MTDLEEMIRQAELQQQQLKLEVQFQKNMVLFKEFAEAIYTEYNNYQPSVLHLQYDEAGFINLINSGTGQPVYRHRRWRRAPFRLGSSRSPTTRGT